VNQGPVVDNPDLTSHAEQFHDFWATKWSFGVLRMVTRVTLLAKVSAAPLNEASICLTGAFAGSMQPHVVWHQ